MGALTGIYPVVLETRLHNDTGCTDMGPLHRYAQPIVAGAPTPGTHQHIVLATIQEAAVDTFYLAGNGRMIGSGIVIAGLHIHHIAHILADAMTQRMGRAQQALLVGNGIEVAVKHLLAIYNGAYLQQVELSGAVVVEIAGKLYLHGPTHVLGTILLRHLQQLGQRKRALLQHTAEGDNLAPSLIDTIANHLVVGVEGGCYVAQRPVLVGLFHSEVVDIEAIIHLEVGSHIGHVKGVEAGLCLTQCRFHLTGLQHLGGMMRTNAQCLSAVHDILAQTQCQIGYSLLGFLVAYRIVVERPKHATEVGIIPVAVLLAHHLLQYHRHLFLVNHIACGSHICLGVAIEHRGIHSLDGTRQHAQHLVLVAELRYHIGGVYSCKGLVMGIFEQGGGAHRNGSVHRIEEGEEVGYERIGQLCLEEVAQYLFVRGITQGNGIELVLLHKLIEEVGTQHHGAGNTHTDALKTIELRMALDDIVEECQSAALASERPFANACKMAVRVELATVEHCHHADVLHAAILHNGIKDNLSVLVHILQLMPCHMFQERRHGEDGTGTQPAAHVIATDVIEHRIVGDGEDIVLQLLERTDAHNLTPCGGVSEYKIAKAHVLFHEIAQVDVHRL